MGELSKRQVLERSGSEIKRGIGGGVTEDSRAVHRRIFCGLWSVCLLVTVISGLLRVHQSTSPGVIALRYVTAPQRNRLARPIANTRIGTYLLVRQCQIGL